MLHVQLLACKQYDVPWMGWSAVKQYFNLEIDRHLSLGPSWMVISDYSGGYLLTKTHHLLHIIYFYTKTRHFCCILAIFSLVYIGS